MEITELEKLIEFTQNKMNESDDLVESTWWQGQRRAYLDIKYLVENNSGVEEFISDENFRNKIMRS